MEVLEALDAAAELDERQRAVHAEIQAMEAANELGCLFAEDEEEFDELLAEPPVEHTLARDDEAVPRLRQAIV